MDGIIGEGGIVGAFRRSLRTIAGIITTRRLIVNACLAQMLERRMEKDGTDGGRRFADGGRLSKGRIRDICPFWSDAKLKATGRPSSTARPSILHCHCDITFVSSVLRD